MNPRIPVALLGASGYGAAELLRLCTGHPALEVVAAVSRSRAGRPVAEVHPHLRGFYDLRCSGEIDFDRLLAAERAVLISALPHGVSAKTLDRLLDALSRRPGAERVRVIDLSGDLRLKDPELHRRWYPETPTLPERRALFVYGLPELNREALRAARWVANPGCLASAAILALAPLVRGTEFSGGVTLDVLTGSSGAGRELKETTHHPTRHANLRAYSPLAHRHEPEILQALGDPAGRRLETGFVAHSLDAARGIFLTAHLSLPEPRTPQALLDLYEGFYAGCPFVRVGLGSPELQNVVGSNFCDIGLASRGRRVVVMAALDNLVKGMAGAALQNLNLMCGLPETTGLWQPALRPV